MRRLLRLITPLIHKATLAYRIEVARAAKYQIDRRATFYTKLLENLAETHDELEKDLDAARKTYNKSKKAADREKRNEIKKELDEVTAKLHQVSEIVTGQSSVVQSKVDEIQKLERLYNYYGQEESLEEEADRLIKQFIEEAEKDKKESGK